MHHNENEWFYVLEGEYIAEIGSERFHLKAGDSILGPREVPHAWAFVGDTPGKLLIAFAPAGKMESFFRDNAKRRKDGEYLNDAEVHRAYGLELLGPPLSVGWGSARTCDCTLQGLFIGLDTTSSSPARKELSCCCPGASIALLLGNVHVVKISGDFKIIFLHGGMHRLPV